MRTLLGTILISLLTGFALYHFSNVRSLIAWQLATPQQRWQQVIQYDIDSLSKTDKLPKEWHQVKTKSVQYHSPLAAYFFSQARFPLNTQEAGSLEAHIDIVDIPDEKNPGFLVQISFIDLQSHDKIEEYSRDYYLRTIIQDTARPKFSLNFP